MDDADALFSTCTGLDVVAQEIYHRMTNRTVLGPGGEDFGEDVTKWVGMDPAKLARRGPVLSEVLQRSERIDTADVKVTPSRIAGTRWAGRIEVTCTTALGPFRRVFRFNALTVEDITNRLTEDEG